MADWYVLHAKTAKELEISRRVKEVGMQALVPRRQMIERRQGAVRAVIRNLFPGYVFVNTALSAEDYYRLTSISGVIRILGPRPVPAEQINRVLRLAQEDDLVGISQVLCENGRVMVVSGPLKGLEGQIVKLDRRKGRAKVSIPLFDDFKMVELSVDVLKKSE